MVLVTMKGLRASSGIVTGKAFRWNPGEDIKKIQQGEILVTKMTTPEIIAGVGKIGGLVTEIGGVTCHAAVVARGYGLPCVTGCKDAKNIVSGDMITIEGDAGKVVIVQHANNKG